MMTLTAAEKKSVKVSHDMIDKMVADLRWWKTNDGVRAILDKGHDAYGTFVAALNNLLHVAPRARYSDRGRHSVASRSPLSSARAAGAGRNIQGAGTNLHEARHAALSL